jgi:acyl-coenzyme A synthetase/AMP-(fatty) acid ligase
MLYECWRLIARNHADQIALCDFDSGRQWTFHELALATERAERTGERFAFPQGMSAEFVFAVLQAWRGGRIVCPLELDQERPEIGSGLPAGIVHLKTTSATAGQPRMVAFTADQLMADAYNIVGTMGLRPDWPNIGVVSLAHSYGFSNLVLPLLLHGVPLIVVGAPLPELIRRAAATAKAATLAGVPALWRSWHDADAIPANVRLAISAGAPLPLALEQGVFATRGLKIHNFYGSSECGGIAYDAGAGPRTDASCAGAAMRNVEVSIGEQRCLQVSSRAVGRTYWPESDPNLGNGMFRTTDVAEISHGLVYLRGRISDQINVAGRKVSPETIEKVLLNHPVVRECLVFGVPGSDSRRGETIVACVVAGTKVSGETLKQFLLTRLPAWQVPREWWMVESLSANERGKISRADWRKRYREAVGNGREESV